MRRRGGVMLGRAGVLIVCPCIFYIPGYYVCRVLMIQSIAMASIEMDHESGV